jgi:hypothetical protein
MNEAIPGQRLATVVALRDDVDSMALSLPGSPRERRSDTSRTWWGLVTLGSLVIGSLLRVWGLFGSPLQASWRQGDLIAIARGFSREGANPLFPRVAWRGTTDGVVEGEFPLVAWTAAQIWRFTGEQLRVLSALTVIASIGTLALFTLLARRYLDGVARAGAVLLFAMSPLAVFLAAAVQSDGVMLFGIVLTMFAALRWSEGDLDRFSMWPVLVAVGIGLAGLMKLPALHVGVGVVGVLVVRCGVRSLFRPVVLLTGTLGVVGPLAWALHGRRIYADTGLSLGISNEHHIAGVELLTKPSLLLNIARFELRYVWGVGVVLALAAVLCCRRQEMVRIAVVWLIGAAAMLLVAGRTTSDAWAFYYHVAAVPPAAILVGAGVQAIVERARLVLGNRLRTDVMVAGLVGVIILPTALSAARLGRAQPVSPLYSCTQSFADAVPPGLILASGGTKFDDGGNRVAYDASYQFAWLDRFGWTIPLEDQRLATVQGFALQGAVAFVAEDEAVLQADGFKAALDRSYTTIASCDGVATLYDLRTRTA